MEKSLLDMRVYGKVTLKAVHEDKENSTYFAVLSVHAISTCANGPMSPTVDIEVPISDWSYKALKETLDKSRSSQPLIVKGKLELMLEKPITSPLRVSDL